MEENKNKDIDEEIVDETIEDDEEPIILTDDAGVDREFDEIAVVELEGKYYSVLEPRELFAELQEGDVMIFEVTEDEEGYELFSPVESEAVLSAVFEEFMRLVADSDAADEAAESKE